MGEQETKLKNLLRELFQFDEADLDFGIYRIMNQKRKEINKFIDKGLIKAVDEALKEYAAENLETLEKEVKELEKKIKNDFGADAIQADGSIKSEFQGTPVAKEYMEKKKALEQAETTEEEKARIFNHIYNFFSRYYDNGDFISLRRYSHENKYCIPYNGEETLLHWATKDQYYIKTGEDFYNYIFDAGEWKVHFRIKSAETEANNNKSSEKRYFFLAKEEPFEMDAEKKVLNVFFEYRGITDEEKKELGASQDNKIKEKLREKIEKEILENAGEELSKTLKRKEPGKDITLLQKHLKRYTTKNTTDYFIHKDLGGFLRRELDFYVKNEFFLLDDIEKKNMSETDIARLMASVRAFKSISNKIIEFLAQIEDLQKKLWEKKKFVIKSDYCITLDRIPEDFYDEILSNNEQMEEWKRLYALEEVEMGTLNWDAHKNTVKMDREYLKSHPYMMVDTKFFDEDFKYRLLATFDNLDEETDGLLIKSENWQALNLLQEKYEGKIKVIHIDPPYNTQTSGFLYKNNYQHSSWLSMMENRIRLGIDLLPSDGSFLCHIDENEYEKLYMLFEEFPIPNAGTIAWDKRNPMNAGRGIATQHEYIIWRSGKESPIYLRNKSILTMLKTASEIIKKHGGVTDEAKKEYASWVSKNPELSGGEKAYRYLDDEGRIYQSVSLRAPEPRTDPKFHIPLIHPVTRKPCAVPPNGFSRTPETLQAMIENGEIIFGPDETTQPRQKVFLTKDKRRQISSVIQNAYKGKADMDPLGLNFPYCHPVSLYETLTGAASDSLSDIILDFFAGSGTTGHAVINLNREDGERRKYILVEMGDYFDTVLKPRIQKVVFSSNWKNGVPQDADGISHIFKYMYLEQYEDTLNNIEFKQTRLPDFDTETYFLKYMLDFESRDSPCRLNPDLLSRPFDYEMKIVENGVIKRKNVNLVETFNYLIGLNVKSIERRKDENTGKDYIAVKGDADGKSVLVVWRNTDDMDSEKAKRDMEFVEREFIGDDAPDVIYMNGKTAVKGAKITEREFKIRMGA